MVYPRASIPIFPSMEMRFTAPRVAVQSFLAAGSPISSQRYLPDHVYVYATLRSIYVYAIISNEVKGHTMMNAVAKINITTVRMCTADVVGVE